MLVYTQEDYDHPNQTVTFLDNHDVTRFGYTQRSQKVYNAALAVLLTSRGIPTIYYGTEQYVIPGDASDVAGRVYMPTECGFSTTTTAYQLIATLSTLRRSNDAIAYGTTTVRYSDDNVMVFERQFYDDVVVVAVNRQPDSASVIPAIQTNLPTGQYSDYLDGSLFGTATTVQNNLIPSFTISGGGVCVWQYQASEAPSTPQIGDVISTTGRPGNTVHIYGDGFSGNISVYFGTTAATVQSTTANKIVATVPEGVNAGLQPITVRKGTATSNAIYYNVLSGDQNQIVFHVSAETQLGENIYIVGNIPELGNWNPDNCTESMLNPNYPEWFLPVSVPSGTTIEFKFIKKDALGNMKNGTMFTDLDKYKKQEFFDEHPVALLITPDKNYKVVFFAGYVATPQDDAWEIGFTEAEFEVWLQNAADRSCFTSEIAPNISAHILTLSTCSYEFDDARFVLVGALR